MGSDFRLVYYYLDLAIRRPLVWVVPALAVLALGAAYVLTIPRNYYSEAVIVVSSQVMPSTLVQSTVANERLQFIEQRVLVRENMLKLVEKFDLFPELIGEISNTQLAQVVRDHIVITTRASETSSEQFAASSVFGIGVNASTPDLAADMASEIANMITEESRRARMSRATEASSFLEREVSVLSTRAQALDTQFSKFMHDNENRLPSRLTLHLSDIREGQRELADITQALAETRANLDVMRTELVLRQSSASTPLQQRREELRTLRSELVARSSVLSPEHHEIRSLRSRIAALEKDLAAEPAQAEEELTDAELAPEARLVAQRIKLAEQQVESLEGQQGELMHTLEETRAIVADMPNVEAQFGLLQAERDRVRRDLDDMAAKLNVARLGERLESDHQDEQIRILEAPEAPLYASGTTRKNYMIAVLGASLALGMGCLYVADTFDPRIRGVFDVAPVVGESPLVIIDHWRTDAERRRNLTMGAIAFLLVAAAAAVFMSFYGGSARPASSAGLGGHGSAATAHLVWIDQWKA